MYGHHWFKSYFNFIDFFKLKTSNRGIWGVFSRQNILECWRSALRFHLGVCIWTVSLKTIVPISENANLSGFDGLSLDILTQNKILALTILYIASGKTPQIPMYYILIKEEEEKTVDQIMKFWCPSRITILRTVHTQSIFWRFIFFKFCHNQRFTKLDNLGLSWPKSLLIVIYRNFVWVIICRKNSDPIHVIFSLSLWLQWALLCLPGSLELGCSWTSPQWESPQVISLAKSKCFYIFRQIFLKNFKLSYLLNL